MTIDEIQSRLLFPMHGLDVDNDSAFLNARVCDVGTSNLPLTGIGASSFMSASGSN